LIEVAFVFCCQILFPFTDNTANLSSSAPGHNEVVGSNGSCGISVIELQQSAKSLPAADLAIARSNPIFRRPKQNQIALALVISFRVIVRKVLLQAVSQRALSKEDQLGQHLGFERNRGLQTRKKSPQRCCSWRVMRHGTLPALIWQWMRGSA